MRRHELAGAAAPRRLKFLRWMLLLALANLTVVNLEELICFHSLVGHRAEKMGFLFVHEVLLLGIFLSELVQLEVLFFPHLLLLTLAGPVVAIAVNSVASFDDGLVCLFIVVPARHVALSLLVVLLVNGVLIAIKFNLGRLFFVVELLEKGSFVVGGPPPLVRFRQELSLSS